MGDELDVVGFVPSASKLYRPQPGLVPRTALVERVRAYDADVVTVTAPAGYGKSTFVAELSGGDPRPTAWVSLTAAEDDPAALLTYIALALDDIEPVDPRGVSVLWSRAPTIGSLALHQFVAMFAVRRPFMLVLDDVHELVSRDVHDVLAVLVSEMPAGSSVVLVGRTAVRLPFGRIRVRRRLVEVGATDLAFDRHEAASLFGALGVDVAPADHDALLERTEGWPVAVYLAALAQRSGRTGCRASSATSPATTATSSSTSARNCWPQLDPDVAAFLMDASCLERLSGELCDDVLERTGSALLLEALEGRTSLVIPLDDRSEWYRFHHLMSEFLQAELARRDPARRAAVHRRASEWCDAHGDADGAVTHAVRSGDLARAESMIQRWFATDGDRRASSSDERALGGDVPHPRARAAPAADGHGGVGLLRSRRAGTGRAMGGACSCRAAGAPPRGRARSGPPGGGGERPDDHRPAVSGGDGVGSDVRLPPRRPRRRTPAVMSRPRCRCVHGR